MGARNSKQPSNKIAIVVKATEPITRKLHRPKRGLSKAITIRHRLRQPSRSYIVGASISSDALKRKCG